MSRKRDVHAITSVGRPLSEDVHGRLVRYLISMSIRTGCFVAILFTDGWLRWVMAAGAIVLPYVAVIFANAGRERPKEADTLIGAPELEAPPGPRPTLPPIDLRGGYLR
ncbi:DUF3099 domain-containing protein [uncultured Georgenia sp.]|uniref:DUF3099 domain-containing protein n=1 Tax=uncultured Georgenia sp. TaxID=378209 RepID=UPI00260E1285|nr:DUF3099 domain-containing protein [uncultured Georgenia sp.]HLV05806.1 DUF3099 domain-containing protein [Actinomycetaceae bacterium]